MSYLHGTMSNIMCFVRFIPMLIKMQVCTNARQDIGQYEQLVTETIPVLDFMARLTQHIPEKHFKMIRYYGIYASLLLPLLFFHSPLLHGTINVSDTEMEAVTIKRVTAAELAKELRELYIKILNTFPVKLISLYK